MKLKELKNIELYKKGKQQQIGVLFKDIKIPRGYRLIKATEIMKFWDNKKFRETILKENDNDVLFFMENLDIYKDKYIARFGASSGRSVLGCNGGPRGSNSSAGVIFVKD